MSAQAEPAGNLTLNAGQQGHGGGGHGGGGGSHGHQGGHHGGGGHDGEHEGAPEWLISFADNVVLMMGFFVILLALEMAKSATAEGPGEPSAAAQEAGQSAAGLDWAIGVREAFNNPVDINSTDPRDRVLVMRLKERLNAGNAKTPGVEGKHDRSQSIRSNDFEGLVASVSFASNSPKLADESKDVIRKFAAKMAGNRLVVEVRGHTSAAENTTDPSHAYRLSFDRALAVAQELESLGFERSQLRLMACADSELVKTRAYTRADHRLNERVELIVTDQIASE